MQLLYHGYYGSKVFFDNRCVTTVIDMKKNCQKSFQGEVANQINSNYQ
jgi:hypothetical protein